MRPPRTPPEVLTLALALDTMDEPNRDRGEDVLNAAVIDAMVVPPAPLTPAELELGERVLAQCRALYVTGTRSNAGAGYGH